MKKLLLLMLCTMPLFVSCSSDDDENNDSESTVTFSELYTGDYEWAAEGMPYNRGMKVLRFLDEAKMCTTDGYTLYNCYYYLRSDGNGGYEFCDKTCGTGDDWEYFSVNETSSWYSFEWNNTGHTSFTINGTTYTKRVPQTIIVSKTSE